MEESWLEGHGMGATPGDAAAGAANVGIRWFLPFSLFHHSIPQVIWTCVGQLPFPCPEDGRTPQLTCPSKTYPYPLGDGFALSRRWKGRPREAVHRTTPECDGWCACWSPSPPASLQQDYEHLGRRNCVLLRCSVNVFQCLNAVMGMWRVWPRTPMRSLLNWKHMHFPVAFERFLINTDLMPPPPIYLTSLKVLYWWWCEVVIT